MNDALFPWQQAAWQQLERYQTLDRVPQAVLLTGDEQSNLECLAKAFGQSLLCLTPEHSTACGRCASCLLMRQNNHPDWHWLTPEPGKTNLAIDQIRALISGLYLRPQHGRYRTVVLTPADLLGIAAANAFLKFLEEPSTHTVMLLVTETPVRLPITIRSRCQTLCCAKPSWNVALAWLDQRGVKASSEVLLAMARGYPGRALAYAEQDYLPAYQTCYRQWFDVAHGKRQAVDVAMSWTRQSMPLSSYLDWLMLWCDDLIRCHMGVAVSYLSSAKQEATLQGLCEQLQLTELFGWRDQIMSSVRGQATALNSQLLLEDLLLAFQCLFHR